MLLQLRDYFQKHQRVSTEQLARHFHIDEQALEPMLFFWEKKGLITLCDARQSCQSPCGKCSTRKTVVYYQLRLGIEQHSRFEGNGV